MTHPLKSMLTDLAEADAPAGTIDLEARVLTAAAKETRRQHRVSVLSRMAVAAAAVLITITGVLVLVPSARASMDDLLRRFGLELASEDETSNTTVVLLEPTFASVTPVPVPLADLIAQAPFAIKQPSILPDGLVYQTGDIRPRPDGTMQVTLRYHNPLIPQTPDNPFAPYLLVEISDHYLNTYYLSEDAVRSVTVNGQPAMYIRGGWTSVEPIQPGETTTEGMIWDYAFEDHYLSWEQEGLVYRIQVHNIVIDEQTLILMAESLN